MASQWSPEFWTVTKLEMHAASGAPLCMQTLFDDNSCSGSPSIVPLYDMKTHYSNYYSKCNAISSCGSPLYTCDDTVMMIITAEVGHAHCMDSKVWSVTG